MPFGGLASMGLRTTAHGAARLAGAAATRGGVLSSTGVRVTRLFGSRYAQADGAAVHVLKNWRGKYNVVVSGKRGIITTFKNISHKSYLRLSKNYGWNR